MVLAAAMALALPQAAAKPMLPTRSRERHFMGYNFYAFSLVQ